MADNRKHWANFAFCFSVCIAVFDKQANIRHDISSILRPIISRDHNAADQAIVIEKYQKYLKKIDNFFSWKQQGAVTTGQNNYSVLCTIFAWW